MPCSTQPTQKDWQTDTEMQGDTGKVLLTHVLAEILLVSFFKKEQTAADPKLFQLFASSLWKIKIHIMLPEVALDQQSPYGLFCLGDGWVRLQPELAMPHTHAQPHWCNFKIRKENILYYLSTTVKSETPLLMRAELLMLCWDLKYIFWIFVAYILLCMKEGQLWD